MAAPPMKDTADALAATGDVELDVKPMTVAKIRPRNIEFENDVARLFVAEHHRDLMYVAGFGWLVWTGTHWSRDTRDRVREMAKATATSVRQAAASASSEKEQERLWKVARSAASARGVKSILELAQSDPQVRRMPEELDQHPHLLACHNGTIDLRTGALHPHARENLLTRCAPTDYEPGARHAGFDQVLAHLFPLEEVRSYAQLAAGYTVAGETSEDVIFLFVGAPRCGKSTLVSAMRGALGEHAIELSMKSWCTDRRGGGNPARSDLFRTIGRRLVASSEIHPGMEFDSGLLKGIAGGEALVVREEHGKSVETSPGFTLWLVANSGDLPRMRAEDDALWERIRRIPVGSTVPEGERDPNLRASMATPEARRAVLAWAVEGARRWYTDGLGVPPDAVRAASGELRDENDTIGPFIRERLAFEDGTNATNREIKEALEAWFDGERPPSAKRIKAAILAAAEASGATASPGTVKRGGKVHRGWRGVRLLTEIEALGRR